MPLNALTLDDLRKLNDTMTSLVMAGFRLEQDGLAPRFDLTPGNPMRITLGAVMPATRAIECRMFYDTQSTEAALPAVGAEPVEPPSVLGEVAEGGPISAEPSRSAEAVAETTRAEVEVEAKAESGGGEKLRAPEAPAATDAHLKRSNWTNAEDDALVEMIVRGVLEEGQTRRAATIAAARVLNRGAPGTLWRVTNILRTRVGVALTSAALEQAQSEVPETPPAQVAIASVSRQADAGGHSPASVQEVDAATLDATFDRKVDAMPDLHGEDLRVWQWVAAHRARWPHTAGTDLDLALGLGRGEKLNLIALDLGIDLPKLQVRWDCLSRPIRNAQDKITIDGMPRLIKILRLIAEAPAAAAAA